MPVLPVDSRNVEEILQWSEAQFANSDIYLGHGFDNYWDEALALMLHVLKLGWDAGQETLSYVLTDDERNAFCTLMNKRMEQRIPVAYLINESWFFGMPFFVNEDVLIPRSPIAELIADGFSFWFPDSEPNSILDLCTGSGCIAIACALQFEHAEVDASDLSEKALQVASENQKRYELENRLQLFKSDLFNQLPAKQYDLIVSNPPYVDEQDMASLPKEYLHEPRMALEAGSDGLACVKTILRQAYDYLSDKGVLIVEVGNSQEAMMEQFPDLAFFWLDFEFGGDGVFALNKAQLKTFKEKSV